MMMVYTKSSIFLSFLFFFIAPSTFAGDEPKETSALAANVMEVHFLEEGNKPVVTLKICQPSNSKSTPKCAMVSNILLDSGSNGLRILKSALPFELPAIQNLAGRDLANCSVSGGGIPLWGSYVYADITLGGELAAQAPIQIIGSDAAGAPNICASSKRSPPSLGGGYSGVMGIGLGMNAPVASPIAASSSEPATAVAGSAPPASAYGFYSCAKGACTLCSGAGWPSCGGPFPIRFKELNPIAFIGGDNNGWILQIPKPPLLGAPNLSGTLTFGVGTKPNNQPPEGLHVFPIDGNGLIPIKFQGASLNALLDTGTAEWTFPTLPNGLKICAVGFFYCPNTSSPQELVATFLNTSVPPFSQTDINIEIVDVSTLQFQVASYDVARPGCDQAFCRGVFIMGIPFFMGRTVYYGLKDANTPLGKGPFNAF